MSRQLQPPVPLVSLVKTEHRTVIKNEPSEEALEKEISSDIDIKYHFLSEDLIKSETVPENILENKYLESVETQVLVKTEDTSDENVNRGTGQEVIEVQGSHEHSNTLSNLETQEQLVTPVEPHEYTSLAKDKHVCTHCQHSSKTLKLIKLHIKRMHRQVTTMYQCAYCPFKSKWNIQKHIIVKHKSAKDIQWFQCHLCESKFKLKSGLNRHMKVHLREKKVFLGSMNQVQHPLIPVSKVKTEALMEIKNEPPESDIVEIGVGNIISSLEEETIPDLKDIDIVLHPLYEDLIKSEPVPEDILETKHLESVDTQVYVKTENSPFIKRGNKTEDTSNGNGNGSWGTGQGMLEVQGNLEIDKQLDFYFSNDLKVTSSRKAKHPEKIGFARCYKSNESTSWEKEKEKIEIIRAPIIPVQPHEYTSLTKDKHVCNHCQHTSNKLENLKLHIRKMHREVTTMYHCPYCPYKSKWSIQKHIIQKHKSAKDIQWFQYCSEKCAKKQQLNYHCDKCNYKSYNLYNLKNHKLTHLKPGEIQYFYCYHCSHKSKLKVNLKRHIFRHFKNENVPYHCYVCDFVTQKRDLIIKHIRKHFKNRYKYDETINKYQLESRIENLEKRYPCNQCDYITYEKAYLKRHELTHLKPEEIQYFYCYHCSFKSKRKGILKDHIFRHFKNENVTFHCYICDFMTLKRDSIVAHFKKHPEHHSKYKYQLETNTQKLEKRYHYCDKCDYKTYNTGHLKEHKMIHLKPEEIEYFYCYHCSVKTKYKQYLKNHIFKHFRNEIVPFHCYICKFMTLKRDEIIEHLKKHPEHHIKLDKTKYK